MSKKIRLDKFLSENGFSKSREKAKREIIAGWVKVNKETIRTPSHEITGLETIDISRPKGNYVSRGGYKLEKALKEFNIDLNDKIILDLGASTGGFTHCSLLNGAKKVYAVDVGYGQLDYSLRQDDRVVVLEKTNAKNISKNMFSDRIDFISSDLSFISFTKVYPILRDNFYGSEAVALIKPQFEALKNEHNKGVVKDIKNHYEIVMRVLDNLNSIGFEFKGLSFSPITGPKGNIEFLLYYKIADSKENNFDEVKNIIESAHENLSNKKH